MRLHNLFQRCLQRNKPARLYQSTEKDKLEICSSILADSIVNFFAGSSVETTIHTAYAALTISRDLCKHFYKGSDFTDLNLSSEALEKRGSTLLRRPKKSDPKPESGAPDYGYINNLIHLGTAVKHADQNPLDITIFGGIEGATTLKLAVRDYKIMEAALVRHNLVRYNEESLIVLNGKSKTRLSHLMDVFEEFKESYGALLKSECGDAAERARKREDMLDAFYDRICRSGLRKNLNRNEGIYLIPSWQREAAHDIKPPKNI